MIKSPVSVTLNTSTYAAVTLGSSAAYGFTVHAVNSSGEILPFYFATDSAGSDGAYNIGDKVVYNGHIWESTIDANVWSPEAYPAGWTDLGAV